MDATNADLLADLVDAKAQLEVQKLQIQLLKGSLRDKDQEVENEKKLASEWKQKAFKQVREQNSSTGVKILMSPEYKELEKKNAQLEEENEELKKKLEQEQEENAKGLEEEKEKNKQEIEWLKQESEQRLSEKVEEIQGDQQIPQLKEEIEAKTIDNKDLQEEKVRLELEVEELKNTIQKLSEENVVLREHAEDIHESLEQEQNNRAMGRKGKEGGEKEEPFWKKMGLPSDQTCVRYFACCNSQMKGGWLYVTEKYLVFETSLKHFQGSRRVLIKIEDIVQLDKRKVLSRWIPGKGCSLLVRTQEAEYLFRSFIQRNEAVLLIGRQSQALGNTITTTIEDKPANFEKAANHAANNINALPERGEYVIGSSSSSGEPPLEE